MSHSFSELDFGGQLRASQQQVLAHLPEHLSDGRIHIVAAPGSGKTVLGLECLRRLGAPALVLAPTLTIQQQWGERFAQYFLPADVGVTEYVSYDMAHPALLTVATYQALFAVCSREGGLSALVRSLQKSKVGVLCLDEAHHLRSEWQRALEALVDEMSPQAKLIALTATPPYDSTPAEWARYHRLCGEVDEEIFVPQLVDEEVLCPHQDYVWLTPLTESEAAHLNERHKEAAACVHAIFDSGVLPAALEMGEAGGKNGWDRFSAGDVGGLGAFLCLLRMAAVPLPDSALHRLLWRGQLPPFTLSTAQRGLQFVLDYPALFAPAATQQLKEILLSYNMLDGKTIQLVADERSERLVATSIGKLEGIRQVVRLETDALGSGLRMLILTDYIKKELLRLVGTQEPLQTLGAVPIFEQVRRTLGNDCGAALLSGALVLVSADILEPLGRLAEARGIILGATPLANAPFVSLQFGADNRERVQLLTDAFERGLIRILVGTKALLGEGWDAPCINSLILASFTGSFVTSNQMRGRAIRRDAAHPDKTANIWHLAAVEPHFSLPQALGLSAQDEEAQAGEDYDTLRRRFACFLAPAYHAPVITSGLARLDVLGAPFTAQHIAEMNAETAALAADRAGMAALWQQALLQAPRHEVLQCASAPCTAQPVRFVFTNLGAQALAGLGFFGFARLAAVLLAGSGIGWGLLGPALGVVVLGRIFVRATRHLWAYLTPTRSIGTLAQAVLGALQDTGSVQSKDARATVLPQKQGTELLCALEGGSLREKVLFAQAMQELLSAIDSPKYLLVREYRTPFGALPGCWHSYTCPSVLATRRDSAEHLAARLQTQGGRFRLVNTRTEAGQALLARCRRGSYINANGPAELGMQLVQ